MGNLAERIRYYSRLYYWKSFRYRPRRDVTIETWNGILDCDSREYQIGKTLYAKRSYESEMIVESIGFLKAKGHLNEQRPKTVIDVGANIGMICIGLLKHEFFDRAIAFEPEPDNFRLLLKNVAQNHIGDKIDCFDIALSSEQNVSDDFSDESRGIMELSALNSGDHRIRHSTEPGFYREENRNTVRVKVDTLDNVFSRHANLKAEDVSLIWIDIQGHEGYFFDGAKSLLSRRVPVISEFWPYGIVRSGMSLNEYKQIVSKRFSHFYEVKADVYEKLPIGDIDRLFEIYNSPRKVGSIILIAE